MQTYLTEIWTEIVDKVPDLVLAVVVLAAGWMIALIGAAIVRAVLKKTSVDNKVAAWTAGAEEGEPPEVEGMAAKVVFWIIMVFAFVAFFSVLGLSDVSTPLTGFLDQIFAFLPRLFSAGVLLGIAWLVATGLRFGITKGLSATRLDERVATEVSDSSTPPSKAIGETAYWLVFLFFLPGVLDALGLEGLMAPVNVLLNKVLAFLPNLFAALLILGVGWLMARIIQRIVSSVLSASGADSLGEKMGLGKVLGERQLSILIGLIVYILILVPVVIAALDALKLEALTRPASGMLDQILAAVPQIFAAALILFVSYLIARLVSDLVSRLLASAGLDGFLQKIGFSWGSAGEGDETKTPSQLAGWLAMIAIMLFATIEALEMLSFSALAEIVSDFTMFAGDVLLGVIILAIGLYVAGLAADAIRSSGTSQAGTLATVARVAIVVLAGAMALRQIGLAEDIINLAFGLMLGAAAVAAAIAFGFGGREHAARRLDEWLGGSDEE